MNGGRNWWRVNRLFPFAPRYFLDSPSPSRYHFCVEDSFLVFFLLDHPHRCTRDMVLFFMYRYSRTLRSRRFLRFGGQCTIKYVDTFIHTRTHKHTQTQAHVCLTWNISNWDCFFFVWRFRVFCHWLCNHSVFGNFILLCIMVSSALLALESPIETAADNLKKLVGQFTLSRRKLTKLLLQILDYFDYVFTGIFSAELLLKTIAYGVILHDGAFLRSAFNVLDLVVVCVSVIAITQR